MIAGLSVVIRKPLRFSWGKSLNCFLISSDGCRNFSRGRFMWSKWASTGLWKFSKLVSVKLTKKLYQSSNVVGGQDRLELANNFCILTKAIDVIDSRSVQWVETWESEKMIDEKFKASKVTDDSSISSSSSFCVRCWEHFCFSSSKQHRA